MIRKYFTDSSLNVVGLTSLKASGFLMSILIARSTSQNTFGEYSLMKTIILSLGLLLSFGIGQSMSVFISDKNRPRFSKNAMRKLTMVICSQILLITLLTWILGDWLNASFETNIFAGAKLLIVITGCFLSTFFQVLYGIVSGNKDFKWFAFAALASALVSSVASYAVILKSTQQGIFLALTLNFAFLVILMYVRSYRKFDNTHSEFNFLELFSFTVPIGLQEVLVSLITPLVGLLIVKNADINEFANYSVASQIGAIILFFPAMLKGSVLAYFSDSSNVSRSRLLRLTLYFSFFTTFLIGLLTLIWSDNILSLFGKEYHGSKNLLYVIILISIFSSINSVYTQLAIAQGRLKVLLLVRFIRESIWLFGGLAIWNVLSSYSISMSFLASMLLANIVFMVVIMLVIRSNEA